MVVVVIVKAVVVVLKVVGLVTRDDGRYGGCIRDRRRCATLDAVYFVKHFAVPGGMWFARVFTPQFREHN